MNRELLQIAGVLRINPPALEVVDDMPGTQLAAADPEKWCVYIRAGIKDERDIAFALAHEARHLWQAKNGVVFDGGRKQSDLDEYNLLPEELDANAFAAAYMLVEYSVRPLFEGLSEEVRALIYERAEDMLEI